MIIKTKIIIGCILISLVVLQSTLLDYIKIFNVKPDLVLVAIIIISLSLDLKWVMMFSYLAGLFKDTLGIEPLGLNILALPLIGFLVFKLSKKIIIETNYMKIATVFTAVILENLIAILCLILMGSGIPIGIFFRFTIVGSIYTALLFPLVYRLVGIR